MRTRAAIALLVLALTACGGEAETVCDAASQHLAACLGSSGQFPGSGSCTDYNQQLAAELLALDCSGLQSLLANTGGLGKADEACLAPWDCPENHPPMDEGCGLLDLAKCQSYCDGLYSDDHMRLRKVTCELLEGGIAHCQCKGYWLPWPEKSKDPSPEENPEENPEPEPSE